MLAGGTDSEDAYLFPQFRFQIITRIEGRLSPEVRSIPYFNLIIVDINIGGFIRFALYCQGVIAGELEDGTPPFPQITVRKRFGAAEGGLTAEFPAGTGKAGEAGNGAAGGDETVFGVGSFSLRGGHFPVKPGGDTVGAAIFCGVGSASVVYFLS